MCRNLRLDFCNFRNFFKLICALLTVFLIYQELFTFAIEKPTTTSKEDREIDINDIPDVVMCLEPGIDTNVLRQYGYKQVRSYYRGAINRKFIGWNGNTKRKKSSKDILEEALIVKDKHIKRSIFLKKAQYRTRGMQLKSLEIGQRMLAWPYGRCFSIKLPSHQGNIISAERILRLSFNNDKDVFLKYRDMHVRMYLMDKTSSLKMYPDENDMAGDLLEARINGYEHKYKIRISRSQHVQGDPLMECEEYTPARSYNDCIQKELLGSFENLLGCHPPFLAQEPEKMCNGRFNLTADYEEKIRGIFLELNSHYTSFNCKRPCTTNLNTSRLMGKIPPNESSSETRVELVFDRTISVTRSTFSINEQTFLTRLGGSVSSGRTLLWILITLLGVPKVK